MNIFKKWGFTHDPWRGQHGEYWVLGQAILLLGFIFLPVWRPTSLSIDKYPILLYVSWGLAATLGLVGAILILKGLLDLGEINLTPLPYPRDDGQLVKSGVYSFVRHPLYSGLISLALGWAIFQYSLSHLIATAIFLAFFNAKADREEVWLTQKYPDYPDYRNSVKKLIPWLY
jgi:protein-S-isoprenylcysteine O-methyltransferase Ste14